MTKQHFIALADTLRLEIKPEISAEAFEVVLREMIRFCRSQNGRFDEDRFRGYIEGTCGPNGGRVKHAA